MVSQSQVRQFQPAVPPNGLRSAADCLDQGKSGALLLDRLGRILSCGTPAERIFGASQGRLIGRMVSEFIVGLWPGGYSPSYNQRYLVYLCADTLWHKFEATDSAGHVFAVELNLSRVNTIDQEVFLLNVRRPQGESQSQA